MKLVLATGSDEGYYPKMDQYLKTIEKNSNFDENYLIYLGDGDVDFDYKNIKLSRLNKDKCAYININNCVQHGEFLITDEMMSLDDQDIICFTDGDIILQRGLNKKEKKMLSGMKDGDVMVGYNASPKDTLYNEALRLEYTGKVVDGITNIDLREIPIYNTGVFIANKKTWWMLYEKYKELWPSVEDMFEHYAKQQWLISYIVNADEYNVIEMDYGLHSHGHYGIPFWVYFDMRDKNDPLGIAMYKEEKILFRHKL